MPGLTSTSPSMTGGHSGGIGHGVGVEGGAVGPGHPAEIVLGLGGGELVLVLAAEGFAQGRVSAIQRHNRRENRRRFMVVVLSFKRVLSAGSLRTERGPRSV